MPSEHRSKNWRIAPHDPGRVSALAKSAGVSAVVAQLLLCRGIVESAAAREFLDAKLTGLLDPEHLPGAVPAAQRIGDAIAAGRKIFVYGDYDVDGMTGTAILVQCIKLLGGANVGYYVPHRIDEGYGLNDEALTTLAGRGAQMVITVDCGAASVREAQTAKQLGLELIITDHHSFAAELPDAAVIVHPSLPCSGDGRAPYPFPGLCGAGVAFKLAWALCQHASQAKRVGERMKNFLVQALGLAAMGTVADVVPLGTMNGCFENRIIVLRGLLSLKQQPPPGIAALLKVTKLAEKRELASEDIAFMLAPRLNAAGRLGQATLGVELLTTESPDRAQALAEYLHELNSSRDSLERSVYLAANKQAQEFDLENDLALVLAGRGWHPGVIGIVAGRLAEKYHRPVVVISLDELGLKPGVGSARSVPGFDLHEALTECSSRLVSHGGHAAAAGLKINTAEVDAFRAEFCEHAAGARAGADPVAELRIDAETSLSMLTLQSLEQMELLAPFGHGNPRPVLCATDVELVEPPRKIGGGERHLSVKVRQHGTVMRGVAFGGGEWAEALSALEGPISVAFRPVINDFKGRRTVEMQIVDWRVATPAPREVDGVGAVSH